MKVWQKSSGHRFCHFYRFLKAFLSMKYALFSHECFIIFQTRRGRMWKKKYWCNCAIRCTHPDLTAKEAEQTCASRKIAVLKIQAFLPSAGRSSVNSREIGQPHATLQSQHWVIIFSTLSFQRTSFLLMPILAPLPQGDWNSMATWF